jgi:hypothetical protein
VRACSRLKVLAGNYHCALPAWNVSAPIFLPTSESQRIRLAASVLVEFQAEAWPVFGVAMLAGVDLKTCVVTVVDGAIGERC